MHLGGNNLSLHSLNKHVIHEELKVTNDQDKEAKKKRQKKKDSLCEEWIHQKVLSSSWEALVYKKKLTTHSRTSGSNYLYLLQLNTRDQQRTRIVVLIVGVEKPIQLVDR